MKPTLPMTAKAALVALLAWGGVAQGGAQYRHAFFPVVDYGTMADYKADGKTGTTRSTTDWTANSNASCSITGWYKYTNAETYIGGNNGNPYVNVTGSNAASAYRNVDFGSYEVGSGCADEGMTTKGYNIEFDFAILGTYDPNQKTTQFVVATTDGSNLPTGNNYTGDDYVFKLIQTEETYYLYPKYPFLGQNRYTTQWHVNGATADLTLDNVSDEQKWIWYHLKLVVTGSNAEYTITRKSDSEQMDHGQKTLASLPTVLSIWTANSSDSYLKLDNLEVYDYTSDEQYRSASVPTISKPTTEDLSKVYTITFMAGDVLHYQLPSQSGFTEVTSTSEGVTTADGKCSIVLTATEGGTLSAYTTYHNASTNEDSQTLTQTVKVGIYNADISTNADSYLCSFSSSNVVKVMDDDVDIYIANYKTATDMATDLKALTLTIAKVEGSKVIPANNGVFLYKEGGGTVKVLSVEDADLPADFENMATWYDENNQLKGSGDTKLSISYSSSEYIYCLKKNTSELRRVQSSNNVVTIPANKAYLQISSSLLSSSANLSIVFDDTDATGIKPVKNEELGGLRSDALYNLAGQRVGESYKGIVVRNGKKQWKK